MEFFIPLLLKDEIMTLKFNPEYLTPELAQTLNAKIGTFNDDVTKLNAVQAEAYRAIDKTDAEFVTKFTNLAVELRDAVLAAPLGEDEDREELFDAVRDTLNEELWEFQHGAVTFDLQFDEDGVNLDWWEASSC